MHGYHNHVRGHAFSEACCCGGPIPDRTRDCGEMAPVAHHGSGCCNTGPGIGFHRRFESREEKTARLEAYLADLQAEARAVQEKLTRLRKPE